ncbi:MAG: ROK family protein [Clostridia bacterium]|nr:ROK family protein [Clostridia bacterium]
MKKYIGLDIGGTKCAAVIGTLSDSFRIEDKISFPTAGRTPDAILSLFSRFIESKRKTEDIAGIGIACGGPLDSKRGVIRKPPGLPLWEDIEIVRYFEEAFAVKTYLQNDANACAVAEWKYGAGKGCENMIFLTFGTGLGAGLILNGKLYSGTNDNAGEIGHVRLRKNGPVGYNKAGSCEGFCSGSGIRRLALIELEKAEKKGVVPEFLNTVGGKENVTAKTLAEYARKGDPFAEKILKKSGEMFGETLSILIDLFNPQKIVVGGVFMRSHDLLLPHAEKVLKKEFLPFSGAVCEIVPAKLYENIGDVSALVIAKGDYQ